ncbi:MAG: L,D-transpeptidase [Okeania sp. SIO2D1]|nr:L,D-transpeptidase [Okeania sp. SIO2D1]
MQKIPPAIIKSLVAKRLWWSSSQNSSRRWIIILLNVVILLLCGQKHTSIASDSNSEVFSTLEQKLSPASLSLLGDVTSQAAIEREMRLVLNLSERKLYLYQGKKQTESYSVSVGKATTPTPTGEFTIFQMVENPVWEDPWTGEIHPAGEDSPLGLRWIGFWTDDENYIGFHGTPTISSLGEASSNGCVRMRNEDVLALFEQVDIGTSVTVEP